VKYSTKNEKINSKKYFSGKTLNFLHSKRQTCYGKNQNKQPQKIGDKTFLYKSIYQTKPLNCSNISTVNSFYPSYYSKLALVDTFSVNSKWSHQNVFCAFQVRMKIKAKNNKGKGFTLNMFTVSSIEKTVQPFFHIFHG